MEKIEIFGTELEKYKLYGIYINSRKPKQTQNITSTFVVSTLIEYIELEYSCDFQWINKYEKKKIIKFIRDNNGRKVKINSKLFYEKEGLPVLKIGQESYFEIIANYEDIQVTRKNNHFFDLKLKLKAVINAKPMTWNDLQAYKWNEIANKTWSQIENGGI